MPWTCRTATGNRIKMETRYLRMRIIALQIRRIYWGLTKVALFSLHDHLQELSGKFENGQDSKSFI